jgi:hypothetical protein
VVVGTLASNDNITVTYTSPTITSAFPLVSATGGGATIEILGFNFGTGGSVTINNVNCVVITYTPTRVTCTVPAGVMFSSSSSYFS